MDINTFLDNFADQFDDADRGQFSPETKFREVGGWCSIVALSIIAMVDEEYGVTLKGDDIKGAQTVKDIFDIVTTRKD